MCVFLITHFINVIFYVEKYFLLSHLRNHTGSNRGSIALQIHKEIEPRLNGCSMVSHHFLSCVLFKCAGPKYQVCNLKHHQLQKVRLLSENFTYYGTSGYKLKRLERKKASFITAFDSTLFKGNSETDYTQSVCFVVCVGLLHSNKQEKHFFQK